MEKRIAQLNTQLERLEWKLNSRRVQLFALALILAAQIGVMLYWAGQKSNFFIDELFSYEYAHSYTSGRNTRITDSDAWSYENWIDNGSLKQRLEVTERESLLSEPFPTAVRMLLKGRNHQGILNILLSLFSPGRIPKYPGIIFNLFVFLLTQLLLYRLCKELTRSPLISLLVIGMYGFSAMAIGTSIYVRFYALVILLLVTAFRLHQKMWETDSFWRNEGSVILSMGMIYLALKNSELVFIIAGALIVCFFMALLIRRDYKKAAQYFISIVPICTAYAYKKTFYVDMILHPANYLERSGPQGWMTQNMMSFQLPQMKTMTGTYLDVLSFQLFGSWYILCCFVVVILILLEAYFLGKKQKDTACKTNEKGFVWVLFAVSTVYTVFAFITGLQSYRYWSLVFPLLVLLLWKLLDALTKKNPFRSIILTGCALLTLTGILVGELKHSDKIAYVFRDDRAVIRQVRESEIRDCIVIHRDHQYGNLPVYECINLLPEEARLYPVGEWKHRIDTDHCPDELIIWNLIYQDLEPYVNDLSRNGYTIEKLGSTHTSDVYLARRERIEQP